MKAKVRTNDGQWWRIKVPENVTREKFMNHLASLKDNDFIELTADGYWVQVRNIAIIELEESR